MLTIHVHIKVQRRLFHSERVVNPSHGWRLFTWMMPLKVDFFQIFRPKKVHLQVVEWYDVKNVYNGESEIRLPASHYIYGTWSRRKWSRSSWNSQRVLAFDARHLDLGLQVVFTLSIWIVWASWIIRSRDIGMCTFWCGQTELAGLINRAAWLFWFAGRWQAIAVKQPWGNVKAAPGKETPTRDWWFLHLRTSTM